MINIPRSIGNYVLEHELGRGATAQVWQGRHRFLHERTVAVKILLSQDEESVERFGREADLASRLRHANIVSVYDHGTAGNFMYTIMELVPGGSLRQLIERGQRVELKQAVSVFRQIGSALDFAHQHEIIHRDVSPGNILLDAGTTGRALLTDFGIARQPQQSHTTTNVIMGTPGFFSPEHAQSATAVTALSDLYGLGVILYVMLTGALPWDKQPEHPDYVFGPIIPLTARGLDLPPDVDRVFQTLLAIDPKKRYPTAAATVEALDRALARSGIVLNAAPTVLPETGTFRAVNIAPGYQSFGVLESEVDQFLGPDLLREPIEKAHARAESLRDPLVVAALLDGWSRAGRFHEFRIKDLGRRANLRDVRSRNVYFYRLDALLETRAMPDTIEEPDRDAVAFPVQREQELWKIKLPPPKEFEDDAGRAEIIPGSERIIECPRCDGHGQEICPQCKGSRRIMQTRTVPAQSADGDGAINTQETLRQPTLAAGPGGTAVAQVRPALAQQLEVRQTLIPCPHCGGAGGLNCGQCQGIGRLVQRKVFPWQRTAVSHTSRDDLPNLDEGHLRSEVEMVPVYQERSPTLKREWSSIPGLRHLVQQVERELRPETRVVMAEVTVQMIPYTTIELDMGHQDVVDDGATPAAHDDSVYTIQVYGFENKLQIGTFAVDGERRWLYISLIFLLVVTLIYTVYIFLVW